MTYDDPDVEQLQWLLVMIKSPTIMPTAAEIDRCLETVARIYHRLHPEQVTLEFTMGEDCAAGDWLGIDSSRGTVRRLRVGDDRLGTADRGYAKGERITWPPRTGLAGVSRP